MPPRHGICPGCAPTGAPASASNPAPASSATPDDPYAPAAERPEPPPPPPEPPSADEEAAALAWLDLAIEYRLHQRPPDGQIERQRRQMLELTDGRWATPYDLACAIRAGHWWPPPAGWRWYPPAAPRTIPEDWRARLSEPSF